MTATATARLTEYCGLTPSHGTIAVKANAILYKGTLVSRTAAGLGIAPVDGDGFPAVGVAAATYDNTGGADSAINAELAYGVHGFAYTGSAPVAGDIVYMVDNQTVSTSSAGDTRGVAGYVSEKVGTIAYVVVGMGSPGFLAALAAHDADVAALQADALHARRIAIPLTSLREAIAFNVGAIAANGGVLASDTTPVLSAINGATDGCQRVRWAAANVHQVIFQINVPEDLDDTVNLKLYTRTASGGTTNAVGFAVASYFDEADTAIADTSATNQTVTYANALTTIAAADVPAGATTLTIGLTPVAHGTDVMDLTAVWLEYTPKLLP